MAQAIFEKFRELAANAGVNISNTFKMTLIPTSSPTSNIIKAITSCTGAASPITLTVGSTAGWSNGDLVQVWGITGNTAANQLARIANITGTTFDIQTNPGPGESQLAMTGNGAATVTSAFVINLSLASASTDLPASAGSSTAATLASVTNTKGKFSCTSPVSITNVAASTGVKAAVFHQSTGTDRLALWSDGYEQVRVVTAASTSATTINVEPLYGAIANGTAIVFSNGITATLTAQANAGATALTVSALSGGIAIGHTADAPILNFNLPATMGSPGNQTFNYNVDATNGLFTL